MTKPTISYEDFEKLDLRVGEIIDVEEIAGADKLYKLTIDVGEETRTVCAGIKEYYSKDDLKGKKIILLANLAPRKLKGIESQGMLLAAVTENHEEVVLLSPESEIGNGSNVR
jgi:methionyl-tRNA synthetase